MRRRFLLTPFGLVMVVSSLHCPAVHVRNARDDEFVLELTGLRFREATPDEIRHYWIARKTYALHRGRAERQHLLHALN